MLKIELYFSAENIKGLATELLEETQLFMRPNCIWFLTNIFHVHFTNKSITVHYRLHSDFIQIS